MNVLETLRERGFVEKTTHDQDLRDFLASSNASCYIGFDPTASSLHVGHLLPIMSLAHLQRQGHRPIALVGGGTGLVGDPSGKTEMRQLLTPELVEENVVGIKKQLAHFIDFNENNALLINNAEWLNKIEYIPFLRDIGKCFSVNRMIKAESYRSRLESEDGLSFIEFNYMILQAYDFLMLYDKYDCKLQLGGSDQWGNIIAGIDLVRKIKQDTVFGITFPLITTSSGAKMGKTAGGAVWLDASLTSPYDYYQYWINSDDQDIARFLALFTFLPMNEINEVKNLSGAKLNMAKSVLAFEATVLAHGQKEALKAHKASTSMFGTRVIPDELLPSSSVPRKSLSDEYSSVPTSKLDAVQIRNGIAAFKLFQMAELCNSGAAARRLIEQGGAYVNGERVEKFDQLVAEKDLNNDEILLRAGKKKFHIIKII
ncbi:MAG: tyrosine--tRNA ligase [Desulfobacterales bacterium]